MRGNPFDLNRDGRWSVSERAFAHYGIGGELRRADEDPSGGGGGGSCLLGCGCSALVLVALFVALSALLSCVGA